MRLGGDAMDIELLNQLGFVMAIALRNSIITGSTNQMNITIRNRSHHPRL